VTGLYDLSDPDRALEALVQPFGGKMHRISPYLRVLALF
jgi:transmembrane sensor